MVAHLIYLINTSLALTEQNVLRDDPSNPAPIMLDIARKKLETHGKEFPEEVYEELMGRYRAISSMYQQATASAVPGSSWFDDQLNESRKA